MVEEIEFDIAVAWCYDCKTMIGPTHAADVGADVEIGVHEDHETEIVDEWTEAEKHDPEQTADPWGGL